MNELNIAGKVIGKPEIKTSENGNNYAQLLLKVKRSYKNKDNSVDSDIFQLTLFNHCIEDSKDILNDGNSVIVKGHVSTNNFPKDGKTIYSTSIIADHICPIENFV